MNWISFLFLGIGVAFVYFMYRSNQATTLVPAEHQVPIPPGGLEAIEYFWRPG